MFGTEQSASELLEPASETASDTAINYGMEAVGYGSEAVDSLGDYGQEVLDNAKASAIDNGLDMVNGVTQAMDPGTEAVSNCEAWPDCHPGATPTTGDGYGVVAGILALLGAGILATRRRE